MTLLEKAIRIALDAHAGQREKNGMPYILHPMRVLGRLEGEEEKMAGVLHDVVEDTPVTLADLRAQGLPERVLEAVDLLTRRPDQDYEAYIEAIARHPVALKVKLADLEDNMDISRLPDLGERDLERLRKYLHVHRRLRHVQI